MPAASPVNLPTRVVLDEEASALAFWDEEHILDWTWKRNGDSRAFQTATDDYYGEEQTN